MRKFDSGATRDSADTKFDYDGFISPLTVRAYGEYMHKHRVQADGSLRASDNWRKGIPIPVYRKSLARHYQDVKAILSGWGSVSGQATDQEPQDILEALCGLKFNTDGLIHEIMQRRLAGEELIQEKDYEFTALYHYDCCVVCRYKNRRNSLSADRIGMVAGQIPVTFLF